MAIEQIGEVVQNLDKTEVLLMSGLVTASLIGLIKSYRSLRQDNFDDSVFLNTPTDSLD